MVIEHKNPIHLREILIALAIGVVMLTLGGIFDLNLTKSVYDPINTNVFGIIFSGIAELPVCLATSLCGTLLIVARPKGKKVAEVFCFVVGIIAIGICLYFTYDTFMEIADFNSTQEHKTLIRVFAILFSLLFTSGIVLLGFFKCKNFDKPMMLRVSVFILIICAAVAITSTGCKFLWSRPRPRYIWSKTNQPEGLFHAFWELNPFACLKADVSDDLKSFPSGHTTYASLAIFVLPLLTLISPKAKDDRKLQIILFYVGLCWALVSALSRVLAGAHFLSDVSAGFLITTIAGYIVTCIAFRQKKDQ